MNHDAKLKVAACWAAGEIAAYERRAEQYPYLANLREHSITEADCLRTLMEMALRAEKLERALRRLRDTVRDSKTMNDRKYIDLGIQVSKALGES